LTTPGEPTTIELCDQWAVHSGWDRATGDPFTEFGEPDLDTARSDSLKREIRALGEQAHALVDEHHSSRESSARHFDMGITTSYTDIVQLVFGAGGAAAFIKGAKPMLLEWLKNRGSRQLIVKKGDFEVTVTGASLEDAITAVERLEKSN
jgi:hypothetical protein